MFLEKCITIIQETFPSDWDEGFKFDTEENAEDANAQLLTKISFATGNIFYNLNLSVLAGEYLIDPNFEATIEKLLKSKEGILIDLGEATDIYRNQFISSLFNGFLLPINIAIKNYSGHYKSILRKYEHPERQSIFEAISINSFSIPNNLPIEQVKNSLEDFINYNLKLSFIDHNLAVRPKQLEELILIYHSLDERPQKTDDDIFLIIKEKCSFLIRKILIRFDKDPLNYYYALDFEDKTFNGTNFDSGCFIDYWNSTCICNSEKTIEKGLYSELKVSVYEIDKSLRQSNVSIFENYFKYVKYYKENNQRSFSRIEESIKCFKKLESIYDKKNDPFNRWAYRVSLNYLINNQLSYDIKNDAIRLDNFTDRINEIRFIQSETEIKSYFPYLKLLQFIIIQCENKLIDFSENEKNLHKVLVELDAMEKDLYQCFEWCSDRNFIPFQTPKNECIKEISVNSTDTLNIFLSSSFVIPINFQKVINDIEKVSKRLIDLKSKVTIYSTLQNEKEQIKVIKASVEKADRRQIEILSIFAAIVLFVSSNIQIFSKAETFTDALRFMLIFAYVLILFVMAIWFISRDNGFKFTIKSISPIHWFLMGLLVISSCLALLIIYPDFKNKSMKKTETNISNEVKK